MTLLRIAAVTSVLGYVRLRYRIRGFGHLPKSPGGTLILANAQSEVDDTAMVPLLSFDDSLRRPIHPVASRRLFEPGFLAVRISWLSRVLYAADFSRLFAAIAIQPLENELSARPLRSFAAALRQDHANVRLRDVLGESVCNRFGIANETIDDVFRWKAFRMAGSYVRLREVREPFRAQLLAATRIQLDADIAGLEKLLQAGATLYLVPEGRFQIGGRIERFGSVVERLAPNASVVACGISYDPFRSGRLSFLYRLISVPAGHDLPDALRAARPVTISQLLAHRLTESNDAFRMDELARHVASTIRSLPRELLCDPEIGRATTLSDAVGSMLRSGVLVREGDRFRSLSQNGGVEANLLKEQAETFSESVAAARRRESLAGYSSPAK